MTKRILILLCALLFSASSAVVQARADDDSHHKKRAAGDDDSDSSSSYECSDGDSDSTSSQDRDDDSSERRSPADVITFLETQAPEIAKELLRTGRKDSEAYEWMLEEAVEHFEFYNELAEEQPERAEAVLKAYRLEHKSWKMADALARAKKGEKREKRAESLRKVLGELFDLRLAEEEAELAMLERETIELRQRVKKRQAQRDAIIDRRFQALLADQEDEELGWW